MANKFAKQNRDVQKRKHSSQPDTPEHQKVTQTAQQPDTVFNSCLAWRLGLMDQGGDWACNLNCLHEYHDKLREYERLTIREIFHSQQHRHSHLMPLEKICKAAQNRIAQLQIDPERLYQLALGGPVRLWGVLESHIFHILWLDTEHTVYPVEK